MNYLIFCDSKLANDKTILYLFIDQELLKNFMLLLRLAFHLCWLPPLFFQKYFLSMALMLLVGLFYIKCFKIRGELGVIANAGHKESDAYRKLKLLESKWKFFTFLP